MWIKRSGALCRSRRLHGRAQAGMSPDIKTIAEKELTDRSRASNSAGTALPTPAERNPSDSSHPASSSLDRLPLHTVQAIHGRT